MWNVREKEKCDDKCFIGCPSSVFSRVWRLDGKCRDCLKVRKRKSYIVGFKASATTNSSKKQAVTQNGGKLEKQYRLINAAQVKMSEQAAKNLNTTLALLM